MKVHSGKVVCNLGRKRIKELRTGKGKVTDGSTTWKSSLYPRITRQGKSLKNTWKWNLKKNPRKRKRKTNKWQ